MGRIKELFESLDDDDDKVVSKSEFVSGGSLSTLIKITYGWFYTSCC